MAGNDNFIEKLVCGRQIRQRDQLVASNADLGNTISDMSLKVLNLETERTTLLSSSTEDHQQLMATVDALNKKITDLNTQIVQLQAQLSQNVNQFPKNSLTFGNLPMNTQTLLLTYMNKYPEAYITYGGRYFGVGHDRYDLDVKAWLLGGQNDRALVSMVKNARAMVVDVLAEQPTLTFHQACDVSFMRLTHAMGDSIAYTYDSRSWGENEFWQFSSETLVMNTGDCEDKAIMNYIGARIAGIPWEMLRITAGLTFSGEGHCTNFYYASDLKWHHRNSTTNYAADKTATSLPLTGDDSENLNIKTPWFSSTETKTFSWFGTDAAREDALSLAGTAFFKYLKNIPL
jgi:hypothetical protein